jgi:hypothetical protein
MIKWRGLLVCGLMLAGVWAPSAAAAAQAGPGGGSFDPRSLRPHVRGEPTRVLVLASPHLSALPTLDAAALEPLLRRLQAFAPTAIAVETLPAETLHTLAAFEDDYAGVAEGFGATHRRLGALAQAGPACRRRRLKRRSGAG